MKRTNICKDMTNTITQRFRDWFTAGKELKHDNVGWNMTACSERFEQFIQQELSTLFTKFEEVIADEPAALIPRTREHLEAYRVKLETRNRFREEIRQKLAELKKEYTGGEK